MAQVTIVLPPKPDNPSEHYRFDDWLPNKVFNYKPNLDSLANYDNVVIEKDDGYVAFPKGAHIPESIIAIWKADPEVGIRIGLCFYYNNGSDEYYICPLRNMFYVGTGDLAGHYLADIVGIGPENKYVARGALVDAGTDPPTSGFKVTGPVIKSCWSPWLYVEADNGKKYLLVWSIATWIIAAAIFIGVLLAGAALTSAIAWWNQAEAQKVKAMTDLEKVKLITQALSDLTDKCEEDPKVCEDLGPAFANMLASTKGSIGADDSNPPSNPIGDAFNWLKDNLLPLASVIGLLFVLMKFDVIRRIIESVTEHLRGR